MQTSREYFIHDIPKRRLMYLMRMNENRLTKKNFNYVTEVKDYKMGRGKKKVMTEIIIMNVVKIWNEDMTSSMGFRKKQKKVPKHFVRGNEEDQRRNEKILVGGRKD